MSDFEGRLATYLYNDLKQQSLENEAKLLVCVIVSKFDNYDSSFEQDFANELAKVSSLVARYKLTDLTLPWFLQINTTHLLRC